MNKPVTEWIQFFPAAADGDHRYFQEPQPKSDPVWELVAPFQSLNLEMQQVMGWGVAEESILGLWDAQTCWSGPLWSLGCIQGGSMYVCGDVL